MKKLTVLTLLYISIPSVLFMFFWLKPIFAITSFIGYIIAFAITISELHSRDAENSIELNKIVKTSLILGLCICSLSEFGLFEYQSYDYLVHNYKFNILATQPLPVYDPGKDTYMCYYLGFYLIPSLLGKYTSLALTKYYFFIWSTIGVSLTFAWIQIKFIEFGTLKRLIVCLSLLIGSYVSICYPLIKSIFPWVNSIDTNGVHIAQNFVLNQVPVFTRSLSESPQHTIPCILAISFLLAVWENKSYLFSILFFLPATLFLTPFATIGMLPFVAVPLFKYLKELTTSSFTRSFLFVFVMTLAYLPMLFFITGSEATDMKSNMAIWNSGSKNWLFYYVFYLLSTYGIWFLLFGRDLLSFDRKMMTVAAVFAVLLSLFQIGYYNDLNIRSMLCVQLVFGLSVAYILVSKINSKVKMTKLISLGFLFWIANSASTIKFYYDRAFVLKGERNSIENPHVSGYGNDYYDLLRQAYKDNGAEVVKQYSLKKGSIFEAYILKTHGG